MHTLKPKGLAHSSWNRISTACLHRKLNRSSLVACFDAVWFFRLPAGLSSILATRVIFHIRTTALEDSTVLTEIDELSNTTPQSDLIFRDDDSDQGLESIV